MKANNYSIAFQMESGEFDIVENFVASNDADANEYAETHYGSREWYVLNSDGENING